MEKNLSELQLEDVKGLHAHFNATDLMTEISERNFEEWKRKLLDMYGDFVVDIDASRDWYNAVRFNCDAFNEAYRTYVDSKAAWCSKYGCD